jgi:hypothetical protein
MKNITIENAKLMGGSFKNFSGKATKFTPEGVRTFCVALDPELAQEMREEGWNVRQLRPRDEDDAPQDYIQVKVAFGNKPPKVVLINGKTRSILDEDGIGVLDWAELETVDLILTPYQWDFNGKSGVKAYLKSMYATMAVDELDQKYAELPDDPDDDILEDGQVPF